VRGRDAAGLRESRFVRRRNRRGWWRAAPDAGQRLA
jgi:hypothetical protein